jgi:hypothetical protein
MMILKKHRVPEKPPASPTFILMLLPEGNGDKLERVFGNELAH